MRILLLLLLGLPSFCMATPKSSETIVSRTVITDGDIIFGRDLQKAGQTNLWDALATVAPSLLLSDKPLQGGRSLYVPQTMMVDGASRWATGSRQRNAMVIVDGQRADLALLRQLNIHDVEHVRIARDPASLSAYGIYGADGVIEITTSKHRRGDFQVSYLLDASLDFANIQSYRRLQKGKPSTDWLRIPLRTGFRNRHQLNVEGGDRFVGYKFSAVVAPASQGVMAGSKENLFALRSFVEYNHKNLHLQNDINFSQSQDRLSNYGAYADFGRIDGHVSPYAADGSLLETIPVDGQNVPNPIYEHTLGSFDKTKYTSLTDRFKLRFVINDKFTVHGDFSYLRTLTRRDIFLSPGSASFHSDKDVRTHGTYRILRENNTWYEGGAAINFRQHTYLHSVRAKAGVRFFSGTSTGESYGGRGILSDRMSYVSFTLAYDTLQPPSAFRTFDRTLQGYISMDYRFRQKYGVTLNANINHSSLLAPHRNNAVYYGARAYWNITKEPWMTHSAFNLLTLSLAAGTTGVVPFNDRYYSATYRNDIRNEYIYNYYQMGAGLQGIPNEELAPTKLTTYQLGLLMGIRDFQLSLDIFHKKISQLLVFSQLPYYSGFENIPDNGGSITNTGYRLTARKEFTDHNNLRSTLFFASSLNRNRVNEVPKYFKDNFYKPSLANDLDHTVFSNSLGMSGKFKKYSLGFMLSGVMGGKVIDYLSKENPAVTDNRLDLRTIQVGYDLGKVKHVFQKAELTLTAENLLSWRSAHIASGILYPEVRSIVASFNVSF
ncbi:hypothetical protein [Prevotella sp.]|uniref:hypothetical protein n=1 Tax=Prevotella sp. TaxID=59823 RepID=UPI002F93AC71